MGPLWANIDKPFWVALLFGFVFVEMHAIDKDKRESTEVLAAYFKSISDEERENTKAMLEDEHLNFTSILKKQEDHFVSTMKELAKSENSHNLEFRSLLDKQQQLFQHQQDTLDFLTGKLLPGTDSMTGSCARDVGPDDILVSVDSNGYITNRFPHTILRSSSKSIIIDRTKTGALVMSVDIRDKHNEIIVRLDNDGFIVNRNYILYMQRPDKSTILIKDAYGNEMLHARYMNPREFSLSGAFIPFKNGPVTITNSWAVSKSKCNNVKFISPVIFEVKSVFRKEKFGWAFPV